MDNLLKPAICFRLIRPARLLACLLITCLTVFGSTNPTGAEEDLDQYEVYQLTSPQSSYVVANGCPAQEITLFFYINVEQPGLIFDTVGINAAQTGDWTLRIDANGKLSFAVFKPGTNTAFSDGSGWHRYSLEDPMRFSHDYWIHIEIENLMLLMLAVDDNDKQSFIYEQVPSSLRSAKVYAGDFKGDEHWGSGYNIHRAATALVIPFYFGPYTEDPFGNVRQSWVIPNSGINLADDFTLDASDDGVLITTDDDTADWESPGDGLDDTSPGDPAPPPAQPPVDAPPNSYPPAESPEGAIRAFLQAQVDEDIDRALAYVAMDMFAEENQAVARDMFELFADRTQSSNLQYQTKATAYSHEKDYAIVRCAHSMTVQAGEDTVTQPCGSLVLVRNSSDGWQVVQFIIDDLLNVELEVQRLRASAHPTGLILASTQHASQAIDGRLLELSDLSELMSQKLNQLYFDKTKLVTDSGMAWASYIPVVGPIVSAGYTGYQTIKTAITEVLPDLMKGNWEMVGLGTAQLTIGGVQIAAHVFESTLGGMPTGMGVAVSHVGSAVDTFKTSVRQARNQSVLRVSVQRADINSPKYLFLHEQPIHTDPDYGIVTAGRENMSFEYYDDLRFKPGPIKKVIIKSDIPVREWKSLDFDIGYYFTIKKSVSKVLFEAAREQGYPSHSISGSSADFEVYIPIRLQSTGLWKFLDFGEHTFSDLEFEQNSTKEAVPKVQTEGAQILTNGLIVGSIQQQRYLQFDITTTPGKNQTLQVRLVSPDFPLTQPVEIANEIYNAVEELTPESNVALQKKEERQKIEAPLMIDHQITFRGFTPGRPHPRLIGAPDVDWYIEHKDIVEAMEVGVFPNAAIMFKGLKPGSTVLRYQIPSAGGPPDNPHVPQTRKGEIAIEVISADWVLVDVKIEPGNPGYKGEGSFADGSAFAKVDLGYNFNGQQEVIQEGVASWTSPPAAFPDKGGIWHIEGFVSHKSQLPRSGDDDLVRQSYSNIALTGQNDAWGGDAPPGGSKKIWCADMDNERIRIDEIIDLDIYCVREGEYKGAVKYPTGRRIIYMRFIFPGCNAKIMYIYEKPGAG